MTALAIKSYPRHSCHTDRKSGRKWVTLTMRSNCSSQREINTTFETIVYEDVLARMRYWTLKSHAKHHQAHAPPLWHPSLFSSRHSSPAGSYTRRKPCIVAQKLLFNTYDALQEGICNVCLPKNTVGSGVRKKAVAPARSRGTRRCGD